MKKVPKILKGGLGVVLIFSLTSCATIVKGKFQKISLASDPSGAFVEVNGRQIKTPGVVTLDTTKDMYVLKFEKEGYKPVEIKLKRTLSGWVFGNIVFGGVIGVVIDFASSSAYKLEPKEVNAVLKKLDKTSMLRGNKNALIYVDKKILDKYRK